MERCNPAIILHSSDFNEADLIVAFFTRDFGKLRGVAKNAKRSRQRFGGGLEPGTIGSARFVEKPSQELVRLEEVIVERPAWRTTGSLNQIVSLHISIELADALLPLAHASRERFELLSRWILFLSESEPLDSHRHAFYYKWLAASGVAPVFNKCVVCGKDCPSSESRSHLWHIVSPQGGAVCNSCYKARMGGMTVSGPALKYLQGLGAGRIGVVASVEVDSIFEDLLGNAVGRKLKSLEVAKGMGLRIKD